MQKVFRQLLLIKHHTQKVKEHMQQARQHTLKDIRLQQ